MIGEMARDPDWLPSQRPGVPRDRGAGVFRLTCQLHRERMKAVGALAACAEMGKVTSSTIAKTTAASW